MSTFKEIMDNNTQYKLNNYKIPMKPEIDNKNDDSSAKPIEPTQTEQVNLFQTPLTYVEPDTPRNLDTMKFNYVYQHSVTITPSLKYGNKSGYRFAPPPPPPPPPLPEEEFIKRWPYLNSSTFPEPLKKLLQPLQCQLCHIRLNSRISGKMHYESKNHSKKVHIWLQEWAKQTGEPAPKRVKLAKESLPAGPNAYHCESCDIALTSVQHAEQHYSGKKHRSVVMGLSTPTGPGYYDANRKWIRTQPDSTNINFYHSTNAADNKSSTKTLSAANSTDPAIFCSVCDIHVSRESQMKAHLEGSKHAKKLRTLEAPPYVPPLDTLLTSVTSHISPVKDALVTPQLKIDISIYRTPSGSYYCQLCDITLETDHLFNQHLNCKKHIRKQNTNGKE